MPSPEFMYVKDRISYIQSLEHLSQQYVSLNVNIFEP